MKYITVKLTEDQVKATIESLNINKSFGVYGEGRDEHQAYIQRIITKLAKAKS